MLACSMVSGYGSGDFISSCVRCYRFIARRDHVADMCEGNTIGMIIVAAAALVGSEVL